jgi:hypothetical protein
MSEVKKKPEEPVKLDEMKEKDRQLAREALSRIKTGWATIRSNFDDANLEASKIKIEIGKYLVEEFFNNNWQEVEKVEFKPARKRAWNLLVGNEKFPIKSKSARHNLLKCGGQAIWAAEAGIDLEDIGYTSQVYLTKLPCGQKKKEVIELIKSGVSEKDPTEPKDWTSRAVDNYVRKLSAKRPNLPEDFLSVMEDPKKYIAPLTEDILADIKRYPEAGAEFDDDKRKKLRGALDESIKKFQEAINKLRQAKAALAKSGNEEEGVDEDFDEYEERAGVNG